MELGLSGRTAIVTGAAQGIGRAIAAGLKAAGASVHIADRDAEGVASAGEALGCPAHALDLSDRAAAHGLVAEITAREGRLDVLALAAGGVAGQVGGPVESIDEAKWQALFDANLASALWLMQAVAPHFRAAGWGRIVTIASGAGLRPSLTGLHGYAAAKHALLGLTKQMALELGPHGVTVNAIAPGFVLSNPSTRAQWERYGPEGQARLVESIHLRRLGTPADIADAACFLASDRAGWITGQVLSVDGGRA